MHHPSSPSNEAGGRFYFFREYNRKKKEKTFYKQQTYCFSPRGSEGHEAAHSCPHSAAHSSQPPNDKNLNTRNRAIYTRFATHRPFILIRVKYSAKNDEFDASTTGKDLPRRARTLVQARLHLLVQDFHPSHSFILSFNHPLTTHSWKSADHNVPSSHRRSFSIPFQEKTPKQESK